MLTKFIVENVESSIDLNINQGKNRIIDLNDLWPPNSKCDNIAPNPLMLRKRESRRAILLIPTNSIDENNLEKLAERTGTRIVSLRNTLHIYGSYFHEHYRSYKFVHIFQQRIYFVIILSYLVYFKKINSIQVNRTFISKSIRVKQ